LQFVCSQSNPGGAGAARGELRDDGRWLTSYDLDPQGWYKHGLTRDAMDTGAAPFDPATSGMRTWMRSMLVGWLERGVDGLHFDLANGMPLWFWQEIASSVLYSRPDALLTGGWNGRGWDDTSVAFANRSGLRSTDFAFQRSVIEALCWGEVGGFKRIASYLDRDEHLEDATSLLTSLDDARVPRLLSSGLRPDQLKLAVTLLMTTRGVPWIFYGTEQGLHCQGQEGGEPYNRPMMERFDDSAVTEAIWKLAALRRENLAVQRGLYRTLWVHEDALVFARSHGQDRIVVGLNRGRDITIDLAEVPLPDGPVFDVLGGGGALVRDKKIERFHLRSGEAVVLARTLQRENAGRSVLCRLSGYRSRFGESVVVTGNVPELGSWDLARAVPLHFVNANLWMGGVSFERSLGKPVLYKYAVLDQRGAALREDRLARRRVVPTCCGLEWADRWGTDG
jgi:cyclomaltodextrin glucanotransferase